MKPVDPQAYKCPYCRKTLRTTPTTMGCLILMLLIIAFVVVANWTARDGERVVAPPAPISVEKKAAQPPSKIETVITIQKYLGLSPTKLYPALRKDLRAGAGVNREMFDGDWLGFARFKGGHLEVYEEGGRIESISVFFEKPVPDYAAALALIGLSPADKSPTREVPGEYRWNYAFPGISEVRAFREPVGGNAIHGVGLKP